MNRDLFDKTGNFGIHPLYPLYNIYYCARDYLLSLGTLLATDSPVYYNVAPACVAIKEFYWFGGNEPKRHAQRAKGGSRRRLRDDKLRRPQRVWKKKKTISRNRTLHYAAGSSPRHYFESLLYVPCIYSGPPSKSNFDKGRENNCAKPRERGLE